MNTDQWSEAPITDATGAADAALATSLEGLRWFQEPGVLSPSTVHDAINLGGRHTIADDDGAIYDCLTDTKVRLARA